MQQTVMHQTAAPLASRKAFAGQSLNCQAPLRALPARQLPVAPTALFTRQKNKQGKKQPGYDSNALEVDPLQPAFTRRRELFAGRLAMFGFSASIVGEILTGKGFLGQLALETGLPQSAVELGLVALIAYNFIQGLRPGSPTFSEENQRDIRKRPAGGVQDPNINLVSNPKKFLGITEFGFTKNNEIFVGRVAQLGVLASVIGEKVTGQGPLTQFGIETGIPLGQASIGLVAFILFLLVAAVFEGNYGFNNTDDKSEY